MLLYSVLFEFLISEMCSANKSSIEVSFLHLGQGSAILAVWLADVPKEMFNLFDEVLTEVVMLLYPNYDTVCTWKCIESILFALLV